MHMSNTVVMKFGGTSLSLPERRTIAADRVCKKAGEGKRIVVVVSAMGRRGAPYATDTLLDLVRDLPHAGAREIDALAACGEEISAAIFASILNERGVKAISLRGFQAGIVTDGLHREASILEIRPGRMLSLLDQGTVVVVAGFQGTTLDGDVTTLSRGGSDTTAMSIGAALRAEVVEIYTDVDGVLTADPKVVADARAVPEITHEESAELALKGAEVLHPVAAERAQASGLSVKISNFLPGTDGTWLVSDEGRWLPGKEKAARATAVTSAGGIAQLRISDARFHSAPDLVARIFTMVAERGVTLDMMSVSPDRVAFTLDRMHAQEIAAVLSESGLEVEITDHCARVTLVGGGIHGIPGVMSRILRALARRRIGIRQSVDSNMIIGVLVDGACEEEAVRAVHEEFFG